MLLLTVLTVVSALYWVAMALLLRRIRRVVPSVLSLRDPPPAKWPRLSLVMPARNEESTLEPALRSKLKETYPDLELILVNDRSTDATGAVGEALARTEPRLRVVHVDTLPEGWLGKVHAMQRGYEQASGEWILFSDADIHLAPGVLERVIAYAEQERCDHVAVLPKLTSSGAVLRSTLSTFLRVVCVSGRIWAVSDPRSSASMGVGAFNLVRRSALARTPGLEWLKMEIGDDVALGMMLKRSGARQAVLLGEDAVSLEFYPSFHALTRSLEKNGASFPFPLLLGGHLLMGALEIGFLAGLFSGQVPLMALSLATWAVGTWTTAEACLWAGFPRWLSVLPFFGVFPLAWAMLRSGVLALIRGGVVWRGTFYPTAMVRAGARVVPGSRPLESPRPL